MSFSQINAADAGKLIKDLTVLVARAAAKINALSERPHHQRLKPDGSPVTAADEAAEEIILDGLADLLPGVSVVSEEQSGKFPIPTTRSFVLVDPLDGTREFVAGHDDFTVNVAIISDSRPLAGVIAAPRHAQVWRGIVGAHAERLPLSGTTAKNPERITTRRWGRHEAVALVSRSHLDHATETFLAGHSPLAKAAVGSSLKFCRIAEGVADIYPRLGTTCEWDIAAGHAILSAAGGRVTTPDGAEISYGNASVNFRVPRFIAWGVPGCPWLERLNQQSGKGHSL